MLTRESQEETMHNHEKRRSGRGKGPLPIGLLVLVAVGALIAVLVFRVSPLAVVIGAVLLLCPLLHLGGGHNHGGHQETGEGRRQG